MTMEDIFKTMQDLIAEQFAIDAIRITDSFQYRIDDTGIIQFPKKNYYDTHQ